MGFSLGDVFNPVSHAKAIGSGMKKTYKEVKRTYKRITKEAARFTDKIDKEILGKIMPDSLQGYHRRILNMAVGSTIGGAMGMDPATGAIVFGTGADYELAERRGEDGWLAVRQSMTQHVANAAIVFGAFYVGGAFASSAALGEGTVGAAAVNGAGVGAGLGAGNVAAQGGNLEEIGDAAWKGGVAGAAGGALGGALGPAGSTIGAAAKGAAVGAVGNAANTALNGGNASDIAGSALTGAAVGGVVGAANYGLRDAAQAPAPQAESAAPSASAPQAAGDVPQMSSGDESTFFQGPNDAPVATRPTPSAADLQSGGVDVATLGKEASKSGVADGGWMKSTGDFLKSPGGGQVLGGAVQALGTGLATAMQPDEETEDERLRRRQQAMSLDGIDIGTDFTSGVQPYQVPDLIEEYNKFLGQRGF